jgi:hypothetical protein
LPFQRVLLCRELAVVRKLELDCATLPTVQATVHHAASPVSTMSLRWEARLLAATGWTLTASTRSSSQSLFLNISP